MAHLLDNFVVGLALGSSAVYAAFSLGPKSWRAAVARRLGQLVPRIPTQLGLRGAAQRLSLIAAAKAGGACGGCDNCASDSAPKPAPEAAAGPNTPGEVRIAVAKIGRRR
jgi:hypothetical protein